MKLKSNCIKSLTVLCLSVEMMAVSAAAGTDPNQTANQVVSAEAAKTLPRFLPENGNNVYPAKNLLRQWPAQGPRRLWCADIGLGKSTIVESGGRIFTATQTDDKQYAVCLDKESGTIVWKQELLAKGNRHVAQGPVSSPLADGESVYFFPYDCENNDFWKPQCPCFCLRAADGKIVWNEGEKFNCSEGTTPLIVGEVLYVGGGGRENALAAVDKRTGKLLWKVGAGPDTGSPHVFVTGSSLICQEVGPVRQIIVSVYKQELMGVGAEDGKVLWHWTIKNPTPSGMLPTPVAIGSHLFLTAHQGAGYSVCLDMTVQDGTIVPQLVYESQQLQCNMYHTPSIVSGAVFGFGMGQTQEALQCTDFQTGHLLWQQESADWKRDRQLTVADGLIFAVTAKDEIVLLEASRTGYKELGRFDPGIKMGMPQQPVISNGRMYLRGDDRLACYQIQEERYFQ